LSREDREVGEGFNPDSGMGTATNPRKPVMAARPKAVLKHAQSKRWREVRCGPANAERLDCKRFIAAFPAPAHQGRGPISEVGFNAKA
jgi:hypothetical protein